MKAAASLSLDEAARRLGVDVEVVEEGIRQGEFPGRFLEGSSMRVAETEVEAARERGFGRDEVLEPEVEEANYSEARGLPAVEAGLERMQAALTRAWEEDRALLREDVGAVLERQDVRLGRIEEGLRRLRAEMQELWVADKALESNRSEGVESGIRKVADELAELEALVVDGGE